MKYEKIANYSGQNEVTSLAFEEGKVYDFQLFKSSKIRLRPGAQQKMLLPPFSFDRGYLQF